MVDNIFETVIARGELDGEIMMLFVYQVNNYRWSQEKLVNFLIASYTLSIVYLDLKRARGPWNKE